MREEFGQCVFSIDNLLPYPPRGQFSFLLKTRDTSRSNNKKDISSRERCRVVRYLVRGAKRDISCEEDPSRGRDAERIKKKRIIALRISSNTYFASCNSFFDRKSRFSISNQISIID